MTPIILSFDAESYNEYPNNLISDPKVCYLARAQKSTLWSNRPQSLL